MQKGFAPISVLVGLLIIVVVAGGAYFLGKQAVPKTPQSVQATTPQVSMVPNGTSDWKTYINNKYKYSIEYPNIFSVMEQSSEYVRLSPGQNQPDQPSSQNYLSIQVKDNPQKLTLQEWEKSNPGIKYYENNGIIFQVVPVIMEDPGGSRAKIFNQILSTFKFISPSQVTISRVPASTSTPVQNGADLEGIKYTLRPGWKTEITDDSLTGRSLRISPNTGSGLLVIHAYDYPNNIGRREYYCKVTNYCIEGTTYYTQTQIGNISGYEANALDNSGGGSEYFGAKGNRFYILGKIRDITSETDEFNTYFREVLNSLVF